MKPIPIGELTEAVRTGKPSIQYKIDAGSYEVRTFQGADFIWIVEGAEMIQVHNPTLAEAIRERCEG
jgi:hypothetical protein